MNHALVWSEPLLPKCIFLSSYKAGPNGFTFCNSVNCSPTIIIIICDVSWVGREEDADDDHFWRRSTRRENTLRWKVHFKSIQKNVSVQFQKPFDKNFVELPPKITLCCCNRTHLKHTYLSFVKVNIKSTFTFTTTYHSLWQNHYTGKQNDVNSGIQKRLTFWLAMVCHLQQRQTLPKKGRGPRQGWRNYLETNWSLTTLWMLLSSHKLNASFIIPIVRSISTAKHLAIRLSKVCSNTIILNIRKNYKDRV